jgi:hypothetical protein
MQTFATTLTGATASCASHDAPTAGDSAVKTVRFKPQQTDPRESSRVSSRHMGERS